ncbi:MAG: ABC transporter ATP-binding protein [Reyranellaceae bacterium]
MSASTAPRGHHLAISRVSHAYASVPALSDITLDIPAGSLTALLGPSGCGKTTLLRVIAGFIRQTEGSVLVDGAAIDDVAAAERRIGIVFQNYALFPHMNVTRNVGYGLRARGMAASAVNERVGDMLKLVQMERFAARLPGELSGGQQQRIALARALAVEPRIMLLDEPFSALDKGLRLDMQIEVRALLKRTGVTSILVTHDQEEALSMADQVVVLHQGQVEQIGSPSELYDRPRTLFVNQFLGHANLLPGKLLARDAGITRLELADGRKVEIPSDKEIATGTSVFLSVRPENLAPAANGAALLHATVRQVLPLGSQDVIEAVAADGTSLKITQPHRRGGIALRPGDVTGLAISDPAACSLYSAGNAPGMPSDHDTNRQTA